MRIDNAILRHQYSSIAETTDKLQSGLRTNLDKLAARMAANIGKNSTASIQDTFNQQRNNSRNSEIALSLTAQGGLSEISDSLKRMRELVMTTTNPSTTSNDRESVQKELVQLQDNIKQVVTNTDYNGTKLFGSFNANQQSTFGASVFSAVASTSETVKGVYELTVTGPSSSNPADTVTRLSDVINKVDQLRTNASNSLSSQERPAAATETVNLLTWEEMQKEIERMKGESDKRAAEIISANRWTYELSNQLANRNSVDLKA